jgi:benzodiazapine receptor
VALLRQAWEADRSAGVAVAPYVAWTAFATALNSEIVRRNPKAIGR